MKVSAESLSGSKFFIDVDTGVFCIEKEDEDVETEEHPRARIDFATGFAIVRGVSDDDV